MIVYLITNLINGKRYVGQTRRSLAVRWKQHQIRSGCTAMNSAILKYGVENFSIEPICEVPTIELLNEFEKEYIQRYNTLSPNGYNLSTGGECPKHSLITRNKLSEQHRGMKASVETRARMSEAQANRLPPTEETRKKLSNAQRGNKKGLSHKVSEEHREILRRPRSEETKIRMSEAAKLRWQKRKLLNV